MSIGTAGLIGVGVAGLGGAASAIGGATAAGATRDAAGQQVELAKQGLDQQLKLRSENIDLAKQFAPMSAAEIKSVGNLLTTRNQALSASLYNLDQQQKNLDAAAPNVKAAGQNLFNLLTGQQAATLKPLQDVLDKQRSKLQDTLSAQMGPGWQTSSAGIEAMTKFDDQYAVTLSQAQQQATQVAVSTFSNLFGAQTGAEGQILQGTQNAYGQATLADQTALQADQVATGRLTNAVVGAATGSPVNTGAPATAQGSVVNSAGPAAGAALAGAGGVLGTFGNLGIAAGAQQASQAFQQNLTNNAITQFGQMYGGGSGFVPGVGAGSAAGGALTLGSTLRG